MNLSVPIVQGPFLAWEGALTPAEVDAIIAYGDAQILEKAQIAVQRDDLEAVRITHLA